MIIHQFFFIQYSNSTKNTYYGCPLSGYGPVGGVGSCCLPLAGGMKAPLNELS